MSVLSLSSFLSLSVTFDAVHLTALLVLVLAISLVATAGHARPFRSVLAVLSLIVLAFATTGLLMVSVNLWTLSVAILSLYQAISLGRLLKDRTDGKHWNFVRHSLRQTSLWLGGVQLIILNVYVLLDYYRQAEAIMSVASLYVVALLQLMVAIMLYVSARRQLRTTSAVRHDKAGHVLHDNELPSITVAIPARNEDAQLEACLTAVLASNYPKLEVLVLDDCSSDKTPEIIRGFAQAGVRFIRYETGREPSADSAWLAKNLAYDRLYQEASGSLILFCGVDIRLGRNSLRQLVSIMQLRQKTMVSILPQNSHTTRLPAIQAMRYAWEMLLPRRFFNRPPVLSSCWIIAKAELSRAGGFAAVKRSVTPEAHFAKAAAAHNDGYSFIRSQFKLHGDANDMAKPQPGKALRISSDKPSAEQFDTAIQTRYPQLHRRLEMVLAVAAAEAIFLLAPLAVALSGMVTLHIALFAIASAAFWLNLQAFSHLQRAIFPSLQHAAGLSFIPAVLTDIIMLHYSMYKYEFSEVYWKGRNICYPVMRAIPRLPKLPG